MQLSKTQKYKNEMVCSQYDHEKYHTIDNEKHGNATISKSILLKIIYNVVLLSKLYKYIYKNMCNICKDI